MDSVNSVQDPLKSLKSARMHSQKNRKKEKKKEVKRIRNWFSPIQTYTKMKVRSIYRKITYKITVANQGDKSVHVVEFNIQQYYIIYHWIILRRVAEFDH